MRLALEQMKLKEVLQGKAGIGGKNKKDTGGHKVRTRPPIQFAIHLTSPS